MFQTNGPDPDKGRGFLLRHDMDPYIQQTDIENSYGATFVAQWSSFETGNSPTPDATRIATAITWAQSIVDGRLGNGPFLIPIQTASGVTPPEIVDVTSELAGWWLWKTRGLNQAKEFAEGMGKRHAAAIKTLMSIQNGSYPLAAILNTKRTNTPFSAHHGCHRGGYYPWGW